MSSWSIVRESLDQSFLSGFLLMLVDPYMAGTPANKDEAQKILSDSAMGMVRSGYAGSAASNTIPVSSLFELSNASGVHGIPVSLVHRRLCFANRAQASSAL